MSSDPSYTPMDHTGPQSRGAQDDRHASFTSTPSEKDELRAQLAQALSLVTQLTQQNAQLLSQLNTLQRQMLEEREERRQMQQAQCKMELRRELRYRQAEARATDRPSTKRAREKERGEPQLQEANPTQSTREQVTRGCQQRCVGKGRV
jgi:hypothetical protein